MRSAPHVPAGPGYTGLTTLRNTLPTGQLVDDSNVAVTTLFPPVIFAGNVDLPALDGHVIHPTAAGGTTLCSSSKRPRRARSDPLQRRTEAGAGTECHVL